MGSSEVCASVRSASASLEILSLKFLTKPLHPTRRQNNDSGKDIATSSQTKPQHTAPLPTQAMPASSWLSKWFSHSLWPSNHSYEKKEHSAPASLRKQQEASVLLPLATPEPFSLASLPQLSPTDRAWHKFRESTGCLCLAQHFRAKTFIVS